VSPSDDLAARASGPNADLARIATDRVRQAFKGSLMRCDQSATGQGHRRGYVGGAPRLIQPIAIRCPTSMSKRAEVHHRFA
jgi:hypothetical protein